MNNKEKILKAMEQKPIWTYTEISEASGVKIGGMNQIMSKLYRNGNPVVKRTNGKQAFYALKKHDDALRKYIEFSALTDEYKAFIERSMKWDRCFQRYVRGHYAAR